MTMHNSPNQFGCEEEEKKSGTTKEIWGPGVGFLKIGVMFSSYYVRACSAADQKIP